MNDINVMVINYLNDVYHIKDTSVEGVEKAIDDILILKMSCLNTNLCLIA